tara:strand:- start:81 stop:881 length:801 start_codon:yes stop_codon:yes gene_type:complete
MEEISHSDFLNYILPELNEYSFKKPIEIEKLNLDEYLNCNLDIKYFWLLLNGLEFVEEQKIQYNKDCFNRLPTKINLPVKHQLCKSVYSPEEYDVSDTQFTDISEYNINLCKIFEFYKDVFPIYIDGKIHFYPILSPGWIKEGNPNCGYLNLNNSWIQEYTSDIKTLCLERNQYYQSHKYLDKINLELYHNSVNLSSDLLKKIVLESDKNAELKDAFREFIVKQHTILSNIKKQTEFNIESFEQFLKYVFDGKSNIQNIFRIYNPF